MVYTQTPKWWYGNPFEALEFTTTLGGAIGRQALAIYSYDGCLLGVYIASAWRAWSSVIQWVPWQAQSVRERYPSWQHAAILFRSSVCIHICIYVYVHRYVWYIYTDSTQKRYVHENVNRNICEPCKWESKCGYKFQRSYMNLCINIYLNLYTCTCSCKYVHEYIQL